LNDVMKLTKVSNLLKGILYIFSSAETLFLLYYLRHKKMISNQRGPMQTFSIESKKSQNHPNLYKQSVLNFFQRMSHDIEDIHNVLSGWFYNVPTNKLSRHDLRNNYAWAFFGADYKEVQDNPEIVNEIETLINLCVLSAKQKQGDSLMLLEDSEANLNPTIRLNLDPFHSTARPFSYYLAIMSLDSIVGMTLKSMGFSWVSSVNQNTSNSYYYRDAVDAKNDESDAVVFVHGIGIGLAPYLASLMYLVRKNPNRKWIILEQRHVASLLHSKIPTRKETLTTIDEIFQKRLARKPAHWIGHSLGSVVVSWVIKYRHDYVSKVSLLDPVVFQMWRSDLAYNFLYRTPKRGKDLVLWFAAGAEINISHTLRRHFIWHENVLFPEQLPRNKSDNRVAAHIFLSERDSIVNAVEMQKYLEKGARVVHQWKFHEIGDKRIPEMIDNDSVILQKIPSMDEIPVTMWKGYSHGEYLMRSSAWKQISEIL
jgi:hypothetical protein